MHIAKLHSLIELQLQKLYFFNIVGLLWNVAVFGKNRAFLFFLLYLLVLKGLKWWYSIIPLWYKSQVQEQWTVHGRCAWEKSLGAFG